MTRFPDTANIIDKAETNIFTKQNSITSIESGFTVFV